VALNARYLADKSALARFPNPVVQARLRPLLEEGLIATCAIVDLEVLYSSRRTADYEAVLLERRSLDSAPITPEVLDLAIDLQHELAKRGQHRLAIPDVITSAAARAAARAAGLIVLHYDADFERVGAVGGADQVWVAPRGSL
jgi:predicted nucleic acid-binding protein